MKSAHVICSVLLSAIAVLLPVSVRAAGGAHVIDDSEVETPGSCHLETSITRVQGKAGYVVVSPACTPASLANLELGASANYGWDFRSDQVLIGPSIKWKLRSFSTGLGLAIDASAEWSSASKRIETASFIVPATLVLGEGITLNANAGAVWTHAEARADCFFGGQIVWQERTNLGFMIEAFDRTRNDPGAQAGLRWNPDEKTDVDLLVSHTFDGSAHENATVGITRRF